VCGSRWPKAWPEDRVRRLTGYVFGALDLWLATHDPSETVLVHGACADSPDAIAARWAEHRGVRSVPFPVTAEDWARLGRRAGPERNERMAAFCATGVDVSVVAFYDGASRGTADMLGLAEARGWRPIVLYPEILRAR